MGLQKALVYAQDGVINRDYEGEIQKYGDTVKIGSLGAVSVGDYTKDTDMNVQVLTDAEQYLAIDKKKYFNFMVDDLDQAQQNTNTLDEAMKNAAYQLRNVADGIVAGLYPLAVADTGVGTDGSPLSALSANVAYNLLVDLATNLSNRDVPTEGRFVVVPPFFHGALLKDSKFVGTGGNQAEENLANGLVGRCAGFDVLLSTNVPNTAGTKYKIIAGHPIACTYADQIVKVSTWTTGKRFGTGVKGLHVYGCKLVRPYAWSVGTVNNA